MTGGIILFIVALRSAFSNKIEVASTLLKAPLRIPMKPAIDSDLKPASHSDFIPAGIPI